MPATIPNLLPAHEIFSKDKPGIRYYKILKSLPDISKQMPPDPYLDEMEHLLRRLNNMQKEAARLDRKGETEQAIAIYQQLVRARFDSPHPYLRLCEYYTEQNQPEKVAAVCSSFLALTQILNEMGFGNATRNDNVSTFVNIARAVTFPDNKENYCAEVLYGQAGEDLRQPIET